MISEGAVTPAAGFALQRRRFHVTVLPIASAADVNPSLRIAVSLMTPKAAVMRIDAHRSLFENEHQRFHYAIPLAITRYSALL